MDHKTFRQHPAPPPVTLTVGLALQRHPAVGRNRLYAALKTGALHGVRVGRRTAIHIDDLDAWVTAGCPVDTAPGTGR